jgi:hypothetical protein
LPTTIQSSRGIVENDTECVPATGAQAAYAMPHVDPISSASAANRAVVDRKDHAFALPERYDFAARLHSWSLLREQKFAAGKISSRLRQEKCHLKRKDVLAVNVLMQAIEITGTIAENERRGLALSVGVAAF